MRKWLVGLGLMVAVVGFLAFRPDKLFLDDPVEESLSEAFAGEDSPTETTAVPGTTTAVLVWCERFSVPFAVAPLNEA
jgi:hypothetical protein